MLVLLLLSTISATDWQHLQPGVEYARIRVAKAFPGDGSLHVVRVDASKSAIGVRAASAQDGKNRTAEEWAKAFGASVVINAGMYQEDFSTHTGFLQIGAHVNSRKWVSQYKSALVIVNGRASIHDVAGSVAEKHDVVAQNLRLIAGSGRNVWEEDHRQWSEAALAMDTAGRILFLFSRTPLSMHAFNELLLKSDLGVTHAHHLEGGPEASLSVHAGGVDLDLAGSFETGFNENDDNRHQWPLPNVIVVNSGPSAPSR